MNCRHEKAMSIGALSKSMIQDLDLCMSNFATKHGASAIALSTFWLLYGWLPRSRFHAF